MSRPTVLPHCPRLPNLWLLPQGLPALQALEEGSRPSWLQSVLDSGNWTGCKLPEGRTRHPAGSQEHGLKPVASWQVHDGVSGPTHCARVRDTAPCTGDMPSIHRDGGPHFRGRSQTPRAQGLSLTPTEAHLSWRRSERGPSLLSAGMAAPS